MISQTIILNTEHGKYTVNNNNNKKKKEKEVGYFLSVEDQSTIDKKWQKVEFYGSSVFHFYVRVLYFIAILFGLSFI